MIFIFCYKESLTLVHVGYSLVQIKEVLASPLILKKNMPFFLEIPRFEVVYLLKENLLSDAFIMALDNLIFLEY